MKAVLMAALMAAVALAGCSGGGGGDPGTITNTDQLAAGKGAIAGLIVDDRYRPLPGATILLMETGAETTSNADGEFQFVNIDPGTYHLRAGKSGHEAARTPGIDVEAKKFAEHTIIARRVVNEGSQIVTQQYSVFIPCAVDYVANGQNVPCTLDEGGYSSAFDVDYDQFENVTYVVIEMKANQVNRYEVQHRIYDDGLWYATANFEDDYVRIQMKVGEMADRQDNPGYSDLYTPFEANGSIETILFVDHAPREEIQDVDPVGIFCCGAGFSMGVRGEFVISIFLGEPEVDVNSYAVYKQ